MIDADKITQSFAGASTTLMQAQAALEQMTGGESFRDSLKTAAEAIRLATPSIGRIDVPVLSMNVRDALSEQALALSNYGDLFGGISALEAFGGATRMMQQVAEAVKGLNITIPPTFVDSLIESIDPPLPAARVVVVEPEERQPDEIDELIEGLWALTTALGDQANQRAAEHRATIRMGLAGIIVAILCTVAQMAGADAAMALLRALIERAPDLWPWA